MLSRRRTRLFLTLTFSGLVLAYWGFRGEDYQPVTTERDKSQDIDGFMINSETLQFDAQGQPKQQLSAKRIEHLPEQDRSLLYQPEILKYRADSPDLLSVAQRGEVGPDSQEILLIDQVKVTEQSTDGYRLLTDFLRIEPDNDYAETDSPVTLLHSRGRMDSIGMQVFMDQDRVVLLQDVRGHHEPR